MNEPTVFIIDDDPSVLKGLTRLLKAAEFMTESFSSALDFLDSDRIEGPGCIVLDVQMPEMTGPELQDELSKIEYAMPIIFLSAHGDVPTTAQAMKMGAVDFLTKPVDVNELIEAIHLSLKKDAESRSQYAEHSAINELLKTLTPREYEVMTYVITGKLNKQIASEMSISEETVKVHRGRLMQKLEIVSVAQLVRLCEKKSITPAIIKGKY
jgi:FixJ family two-component response regulator